MRLPTEHTSHGVCACHPGACATCKDPGEQPGGDFTPTTATSTQASMSARSQALAVGGEVRRWPSPKTSTEDSRQMGGH